MALLFVNLNYLDLVNCTKYYSTVCIPSWHGAVSDVIIIQQALATDLNHKEVLFVNRSL
jgi:hypothetical protein